MMQLARRASLVVMLVLTSVGTASAECAWVLWFEGTKDGDFSSQDAFDRRASCIRVLDQTQQAAQGRAQEAIRMTETVLILKGGVTLRCLPDTVDPRGPKGR